MAIGPRPAPPSGRPRATVQITRFCGPINEPHRENPLKRRPIARRAPATGPGRQCRMLGIPALNKPPFVPVNSDASNLADRATATGAPPHVSQSPGGVVYKRLPVHVCATIPVMRSAWFQTGIKARMPDNDREAQERAALEHRAREGDANPSSGGAFVVFVLGAILGLGLLIWWFVG